MPPGMAVLDFRHRQDIYDIRNFLDEAAGVPLCDADTPVADLPADCFEVADTPGALVDSLTAQGLDPLIIPHGTTWGFYTPTGVTFDKHLKAENRPEAFPLVEIMSGHGNSEEYRDFRSVLLGADGITVCVRNQAPIICRSAGAPEKLSANAALPKAMVWLNVTRAPKPHAPMPPIQAWRRI